jgi:NADPH2:quinone reductase
MRAIRVTEFGEPEVMRCVEEPVPSVGDDEVLVRIHAAGVNPVDTYIRAGTYARKPSLPFTPGIDGAGVVQTVGRSVTQLVAGDRVYLSGSISGTYAEFARCVVEDVHPLPGEMTFEEGAAIGIPFATAYYALFVRGDARAGQTVLVHGASGGVGNACVQLAHAHGVKVFATAGSERGRDLARRLGADAVFDHGHEGYLESIAGAAAENGGIDLVIEMLANQNLAHDLRLIAPGGRIVIVGSRGPIEINPRDIMSKNAEVRGVMLFGVDRMLMQRIHAELRELLFEAGAVRPVIAHKFPLEEAAAAHRRILAGGAEGKIVLVM